MERKLASIRKISKVEKHPNADSLDICTIDAWKVVTKLGEFKENDICVYFEIDSFLPIKPEFEFLHKSSYKKMSDGKEGYRLRTVRLRQQISQGLILSTYVLPNGTYGVGEDVSELLEVIKWEPPIPAELAGKVKGMFPSFIPKTDEERIENLATDYDSFKNEIFYVTEKLDGSSATYYYKDGVFGVCSRNLDLLETEENTFWKVARKLDIENKLKSLEYNVSIQGELCGEGIQNNPYKLKGQTVYFFNVFDIDKYEYFELTNFITIISQLELTTVPILDTKFVLPNTVEELIKYADGKSNLNPNADREGIVIRSSDRKISFKSISQKFLLNEK